MNTMAHPNIARFIEVMKSEEKFTIFKLKRLFNGNEVQVMNSNFKQKYNIKQLQLVSNEDKYDFESFNRAIANIYVWKII